MGHCYSIDHIAEEHIRTDITCNTEEQQQMYRLGTVSNRLLEEGGDSNMFYRIRALALSFRGGLKTCGRHEGFFTHQLIIIGNKQITNKANDESETRSLQKRQIVTPGDH